MPLNRYLLATSDTSKLPKILPSKSFWKFYTKSFASKVFDVQVIFFSSSDCALKYWDFAAGEKLDLKEKQMLWKLKRKYLQTYQGDIHSTTCYLVTAIGHTHFSNTTGEDLCEYRDRNR